MAQPPPYERQYAFRAFQTANPDDPLPGQKVDIELNAVKATLDEVLANLALIQRDDGRVANNSIGTSQLDGALISLGFERPTAWATATAYAVDDAVFQNSKLYLCLVAHTSGTFNTDLSAAKWEEVIDFTTLVTDAETARDAAEAFAADAQAAQAAAEIAQAAAEAVADAFDDKYLGAKSSNPTLDNDGNALATGALYFNTTAGEMRVYTGSAWVQAYAPGAGVMLVANNLSEVTDEAAARLNIGVVNASTTTRGLVEVSTAAEFRNDTADRALTGEAVWDAAEPVTLSDATTIAVDMSSGFNFVVTLGGNRTLGQPTNQKYQSGWIRIVQDGTGSRTLAYHSDWEFGDAGTPVLTTTAGAFDVLFYSVVAPNKIVASLNKGHS